MRALIVGAGAVGQVYGRHLQAGGAQVGFLVKPAHADEARGGFTLYPLNRRASRRAQPERLTGFEVLTDAAAVAAQRWDQVYLAVSSPALRAGDWFTRLAPAIGPATLVLLQPGPEDRAFVLRALPPEQIVDGAITAVSYRAPLPGEVFPHPGVAYWFPPLARCLLSGQAARLQPVLAALRAGGLPAARVRDVQALATFVTALFMPVLAALEQVGWSFQELRRGDHLRRAFRAGWEAVQVAARRAGRRPPLGLRLVGPWAIRALTRVAPLVTPMDFRDYLQAHFTKVGDQTREILRHYVEGGRAAGLPVETLQKLAALG
jgi:ketopantoate reductase